MSSIKPTSSLTVTYDSKSLPIKLPKDLTLRNRDLSTTPKMPFTYDEIQTAFDKIMSTQKKEKIEEQYKISTERGGKCMLLTELMVRKLSDENFPTIKISLRYEPKSCGWGFHIAPAMIDSKACETQDLTENIWVFDPWHTPSMKLINLKDWLALHFHKAAVLDIFSNNFLCPSPWTSPVCPPPNLDCGDIISYSYHHSWISLESAFATSHPYLKTRSQWLNEQEKLLVLYLPKDMPIPVKKIMADYLGIVDFSDENLNTLDMLEYLYSFRYFQRSGKLYPENFTVLAECISFKKSLFVRKEALSIIHSLDPSSKTKLSKNKDLLKNLIEHIPFVSDSSKKEIFLTIKSLMLHGTTDVLFYQDFSFVRLLVDEIFRNSPETQSLGLSILYKLLVSGDNAQKIGPLIVSIPDFVSSFTEISFRESKGTQVDFAGGILKELVKANVLMDEPC